MLEKINQSAHRDEPSTEYTRWPGLVASALILLALSTVQDACAWCTRAYKSSVDCPGCNQATDQQLAAQLSGGLCQPCTNRCIFAQTPEEANLMALALGGPDYAMAFGQVVATQSPADESSQERSGVNIPADLLIEIAEHNPPIAYTLALFTPAVWDGWMNMLRGEATSPYIPASADVKRVLRGVPIEDVVDGMRQNEDKSYLYFSWRSEELDENTLAITFSVEPRDNYNGAIPEHYGETQTTVIVDKIQNQVVSFRHEPKNSE